MFDYTQMNNMVQPQQQINYGMNNYVYTQEEQQQKTDEMSQPSLNIPNTHVINLGIPINQQTVNQNTSPNNNNNLIINNNYYGNNFNNVNTYDNNNVNTFNNNNNFNTFNNNEITINNNNNIMIDNNYMDNMNNNNNIINNMNNVNNVNTNMNDNNNGINFDENINDNNCNQEQEELEYIEISQHYVFPIINCTQINNNFKIFTYTSIIPNEYNKLVQIIHHPQIPLDEQQTLINFANKLYNIIDNKKFLKSKKISFYL